MTRPGERLRAALLALLALPLGLACPTEEGTAGRQRPRGVDPPLKGSDLIPGQAPDQIRPPALPLAGVTPGELVLIPAGGFWMGDDTVPDEAPRRRVRLPAFYMERTEVTVAQFSRFVAAGGYTRRALWSTAGWRWKVANRVGPPPLDMAPELPVVDVSFHAAEAYARWAGRRLPSEAEWEKAARGTDGRRYPWGDAADPRRSNHWAVKRLPTRFASAAWPAASHPEGRSPHGLLHMAGNVWEWTRSPYRRGGRPGWRPWRVIRGGSWTTLLSYQRTSQREPVDPGERRFTLGFRCAADAPAGDH